MKRVLSVFVLALVVACGTPAPKTDLVAPTVANDFFNALCTKDAHYLANNVGGSLAGATEEYLTSYFAGMTKQCTGYRYLGSLQYSPNTGTQYVYVMSFGPDGEMWYVLTVQDGVATSLE